MNVKQILQQASNISLGLDDPTKEDLSIYLQYLNLVHLELYRLTAQYNPAIATTKQDALTKDGVLSPQLKYFTITYVYDVMHKNALTQVTLPEIIKADPLLQNAGKPQVWCNYNGNILVHPKPKDDTQIVVWSKSAPITLGLETAESKIPYPNFYHQVLVDGTAYYIFQGESGLRNQQEVALNMTRWEKGKQELLSYLMNTAGINYQSTYSKV